MCTQSNRWKDDYLTEYQYKQELIHHITVDDIRSILPEIRFSQHSFKCERGILQWGKSNISICIYNHITSTTKKPILFYYTLSALNFYINHKGDWFQATIFILPCWYNWHKIRKWTPTLYLLKSLLQLHKIPKGKMQPMNTFNPWYLLQRKRRETNQKIQC